MSIAQDNFSAAWNRTKQSSVLVSVTAGILLANALLLLAFNATASAPLQSINNAISAGYVLFLLAFLLTRKSFYKLYAFKAGLIGLALIGTILVNAPHVAAVDAIKYLSIYIFFLAARHVKTVSGSLSRPVLAALAIIPLSFALFGQSRIYPSWVAFSYFPNANTAAIYFTALLFAASHYLTSKALVIQVIQVILFQKIGVLLATFLAIGTWYFSSFRARNIAFVSAVVIAVVVMAQAGFLSRFTDVAASLYSDLRTMGISGISRMSYDDIIARQGSTDLSGYFRIKHWLDILSLYAQGGVGTWLFGYGPGRSPFMTNEGLIPHNDYLRVLAEFGAINFIFFLVFNARILLSLPSRLQKTFFTVLLIYFFTENLIDNYASMAIFYFTAGLYITASQNRPALNDHSSR
ncbi:hypothetical protein [Pelagibacterium lentulum]|uniref:Uncharacterized protein n=1 Tax=Pelagibacterium lentulum TaxID=2029865 RepID=A0A916VUN8_9HYPH|nr:hypothetical protein [Pelagibacterium lentulum]GGA36359.1 hypothetical protein GCM10011499_02130 [Pelagibacterium lentulum]